MAVFPSSFDGFFTTEVVEKILEQNEIFENRTFWEKDYRMKAVRPIFTISILDKSLWLPYPYLSFDTDPNVHQIHLQELSQTSLYCRIFLYKFSKDVPSKKSGPRRC